MGKGGTFFLAFIHIFHFLQIEEKRMVVVLMEIA